MLGYFVYKRPTGHVTDKPDKHPSISTSMDGKASSISNIFGNSPCCLVEALSVEYQVIYDRLICLGSPVPTYISDQNAGGDGLIAVGVDGSAQEVIGRAVEGDPAPEKEEVDVCDW